MMGQWPVRCQDSAVSKTFPVSGSTGTPDVRCERHEGVLNRDAHRNVRSGIAVARQLRERG
jgi:hypothetical protein